MHYSIKFVDDAALPEGHDFVLIKAGDEYCIFYRAGAVRPSVLEDSWAAYRALTESPPRALMSA